MPLPEHRPECQRLLGPDSNRVCLKHQSACRRSPAMGLQLQACPGRLAMGLQLQAQQAWSLPSWQKAAEYLAERYCAEIACC